MWKTCIEYGMLSAEVNDMANVLELDLENEEQLCKLGAAFSSPARIQILKLLYFNSYNVIEIAEKLQIPPSSAALYVRSLAVEQSAQEQEQVRELRKPRLHEDMQPKKRFNSYRPDRH